MSNVEKKIICPTCKKKNTWKPDNTFRPFCSERCKLIDLGEWADEKRRLPSDSTIQIEDEDEETS